jgi:AcrR family transcriptional regulator
VGTSAPLEDRQALRAARDVIEEHGWRDATVARLAAALGVSRMTLHRTSVTKATILLRLATLMEEEYREAIWPALTMNGDGRTRLAAALDAICENAEANLLLLAALEDAERDAVFHEDGDEALTRGVFTEPLQRILRDGVADGTLAVDDVPETATLLFNLVGWTYRHLRVGHRWSRERARRSVTEIALRGVAA